MSDLSRIGLARLYIACADVIRRDGLGPAKAHRDEIAKREIIVSTGGTDRALLVELQDAEADLVERVAAVRIRLHDIRVSSNASTSQAAMRCETVTSKNGGNL